MTRITPLRIATEEDQGQITFYGASGTRLGTLAEIQASQVPTYVVTSDGTRVTAYQGSAVVSSGADAGAVLTAIMPAAGSRGARIQFRNDGSVFPWSSVPALPKAISGRLLIERAHPCAGTIVTS